MKQPNKITAVAVYVCDDCGIMDCDPGRCMECDNDMMLADFLRSPAPAATVTEKNSDVDGAGLLKSKDITKLKLKVLAQEEVIRGYRERHDSNLRELKLQANALRILLASHDCLAPDGGAEIAEELSARFDIGLDEARQVVAALDALTVTAPSGGKGEG